MILRHVFIALSKKQTPAVAPEIKPLARSGNCIVGELCFIPLSGNKKEFITMEIFVAWIVFSFVAGIVAASRDRNPVGWFFAALVFSPLVAIVLVLCIGTSGLTCPACKETVKQGASICKHCRSPLSTNTIEGPYEKRLEEWQEQQKEGQRAGADGIKAVSAALTDPTISGRIKRSASVFGKVLVNGNFEGAK